MTAQFITRSPYIEAICALPPAEFEAWMTEMGIQPVTVELTTDQIRQAMAARPESEEQEIPA